MKLMFYLSLSRQDAKKFYGCLDLEKNIFDRTYFLELINILNVLKKISDRVSGTS